LELDYKKALSILYIPKGKKKPGGQTSRYTLVCVDANISLCLTRPEKAGVTFFLFLFAGGIALFKYAHLVVVVIWTKGGTRIRAWQQRKTIEWRRKFYAIEVLKCFWYFKDRKHQILAIQL
jgi:hypothetical protein